MTDDNMIARVALAIAEAEGCSNWWRYRHSARLAILAMRDPAPEILQAVLPGLPAWDSLSEDWNRIVEYAASIMPPCASRNSSTRVE